MNKKRARGRAALNPKLEQEGSFSEFRSRATSIPKPNPALVIAA